MQLTTEHTEKHVDSKREAISFYDFLCVLFYVRLTIINFKNITRGDTENYFKFKVFFKVKNSSVNSVVLFKCFFGL